MNKYSQAAMQLAVRVGKFLKRKSPEIMTGIGVVGIGATIYTTVKALPIWQKQVIFRIIRQKMLQKTARSSESRQQLNL